MPLIAQVVQLAFSSGNWSGPCGSLLDASLGLSTPERGNWPPSFVREIHREWQWMDSSSWNLLFTNYNRKSRILITNEHISWSKNLKIGNYTRLHSLKITEYFSKNIFLYYSFKKKKKKNTVERNLMYQNIHVNTIHVHGIDISSTGGKYLA